MQAYSNPNREHMPHALPDVETFSAWYCDECGGMDADGFLRHSYRCATDSAFWKREPGAILGWYWQPCFPGCLPDGDPIGPFATEAEALKDARQGVLAEAQSQHEDI